MWHSWGAARAQWMYLRAKYGFLRGTALETPAITDAKEAFAISQRAMAIYPHNYYFPAWAAAIALDEARQATSADDLDAALAAAYWCAREAVSINPYDADARYVWGEALAESGKIDEALDFWRSVIDREFWNPDNHTHYARLLLRAGTPEARLAAGLEAPLVGDPVLKRRLQRVANASKRNNNAKR